MKSHQIPKLKTASKNYKTPSSSPILVDIQPVLDLVNSIPSTRYYGSKKKLLPWIYEHIKGLNFETALDGFGGTASVSLLLGLMGKSVTYNDGLIFNNHVAKALFSTSELMSIEHLKQWLVKVEPCSGVVTENFEGVFFKNDENEWIDGFIKLIDIEIDKKHHSTLLYCLFQAALKKRPFNLFHRANLNLRLNDKVTRKFGNATTWETSFNDHILTSYKELIEFNGFLKKHICCLPAGCISDVECGYDLVYLDPPYVSNNTKNNSENYWKKYHFLEGISNYNIWPEKIDHNSLIKTMKQPDFIGKWNNKNSFKESLFSLIEKHKCSIVVLSYVSNAFPDHEDILEHFDNLFSEVSMHMKEYSHALSKNKRREILFIGRP